MKPPAFKLELSPGLLALATGYAAFHGKSVEAYVREALLAQVQADGEAALWREVPEARPPAK